MLKQLPLKKSHLSKKKKTNPRLMFPITLKKRRNRKRCLRKRLRRLKSLSLQLIRDKPRRRSKFRESKTLRLVIQST